MNKKSFFAWLIVLTLIINCICIDSECISASSDNIDVYFTCEKSIIGQGLIVEPCKISVEKKTTVSKVLDKVFRDNNIEYEHSGALNSGFYLSSVKNCDDGTFNIPKIIKNSDVYSANVSSRNVNAPDLAERSFIESSGWFYFVNNKAPNVGMSEYELSDGDVIRVQFTLFDYGEDIKIPANRDKLIKKLASNKKHEYYDEGIKVLQNLDKNKDDISDVIEKFKEESESGDNHKETSSNNGNQNNGSNNQNDTNHNNSGGNSNNNDSNNSGNHSGNNRRKRRHGNSNSNNGNNSNSNQNNSNQNTSNQNDSNENTSNRESDNQTETNNRKTNSEQKNNSANSNIEESGDKSKNNKSEDNKKTENVNDSKDSSVDNDYVIGIAEHESKDVKELLDEEHINKIDNEIEEYKKRIESIDLSNGGALDMQWEIISLMTSGKKLDEKFLKDYIDSFNGEIKDTDGDISNKGTDYSKAVITMSTLGINHIEYEYKLDDKLEDKNNICAQGINGPIWALMALSSSSDFNDEYSELKKEYYDILKSEWKEKKCFSLMGDNGDVDLTAMAVLAGSLYSKRTDCEKDFLKDAVNFIEKEADSNGEFKSMNNINVESLSYATMALLSVRDKDYDFNRAVDNIISYKTKDGLFAHLYDEKGSDKGNAIATQQAMLALCMISNAYHTNSDKLFYYGDNNADNINVSNLTGKTVEINDENTSELNNNVKENSSKNGSFVKCVGIVFIGLLVLCFLCACLYLLLRAVKSKKGSK